MKKKKMQGAAGEKRTLFRFIRALFRFTRAPVIFLKEHIDVRGDVTNSYVLLLSNSY